MKKASIKLTRSIRFNPQALVLLRQIKNRAHEWRETHECFFRVIRVIRGQKMKSVEVELIPVAELAVTRLVIRKKTKALQPAGSARFNANSR